MLTLTDGEKLVVVSEVLVGVSAVSTDTKGVIAYAQEPEIAFVCAQVKAPVPPAVAFSCDACATEVSVPPVDSLSALSVRVPGEVEDWLETAKSGELTTTNTTQAPLVEVIIWACVSFPEALFSPTTVASANGSPVLTAPL